MIPGRPSRTASQNALFRALDARRPPSQRVADDDLAGLFLPPEFRLVAELARIGVLRQTIERVIDARWPCARGGVVARTRLLDEAISSVLSQVEQVLILGAGFDTRPYRLRGMETVAIFEVDHPATQQAKRRALRRISRSSGRLRYVPVVFGDDDLGQALASAGFTEGVRSLVLWEGVTNYLDAESVDATFGLLTKLVGAGSPLFFTYVHAGMLDGSVGFAGATTTMRAVGKVGEPFTFGFPPEAVGAELAQHDFELLWDRTVAEAGARYYRGTVPSLPAYYHVVGARRR